MTTMEMSHRGKEFTSVIQKVESSISANYEVPFLQGGGSLQFSCLLRRLRFCMMCSMRAMGFIAARWRNMSGL